MIEPEIIEWIVDNHNVKDFSIGVLPEFLGKIATWENKNIHRDIGTIEMLREAQKDNCDSPIWSKNNLWQQFFLSNPIHKLVDISNEIS